MSEWISVDEKMPTKHDNVLCYCNDIVNGWQEVLAYDGFEWCNVDGSDYPCLVSHWMPLPEPPCKN